MAQDFCLKNLYRSCQFLLQYSQELTSEKFCEPFVFFFYFLSKLWHNLTLTYKRCTPIYPINTKGNRVFEKGLTGLQEERLRYCVQRNCRLKVNSYVSLTMVLYNFGGWEICETSKQKWKRRENNLSLSRLRPTSFGKYKQQPTLYFQLAHSRQPHLSPTQSPNII